MAVRADGVGGLQRKLRLDRGAESRRVERVELSRHVRRYRVHDGPDRPQRGARRIRRSRSTQQEGGPRTSSLPRTPTTAPAGGNEPRSGISRERELQRPVGAGRSISILPTWGQTECSTLWNRNSHLDKDAHFREFEVRVPRAIGARQKCFVWVCSRSRLVSEDAM